MNINKINQTGFFLIIVVRKQILSPQKWIYIKNCRLQLVLLLFTKIN